MSDYAEWRRLEKEFRDFQKRYPNLYASWSSQDGKWMGFGGPEGEEDRFRALLGLASATAGHSGGGDTMNYWLNLVKDHLLEGGSKNIEIGQHAWVARPSDGVPSPLQMSTTEPFVQLGKVFTIRPLCQASADYCLERERRALTAQRGIQEKLTTDRGQIPAKAKQLGNDLTVQPDSPRRRGRPAIGAEIKRQALEVKQMPGKTNKDVAKILYGTTYPTLAQVRNVTTILRHFQKTSGVKKL